MSASSPDRSQAPHWTRREFLRLAAATAVATGAGWQLKRPVADLFRHEDVFLAPAKDYGGDLAGTLRTGLKELGVTGAEIKGRRVFLKPNLVEPHRGHSHINTHPLVVRGAIEAFLALGAASVVVGEAPGHRRDVYAAVYDSGFREVLAEDHIRFVDLNAGPLTAVANRGGTTRLDRLHFARELLAADFVVSIAKMKTHHWAGVTLTMKNLFGTMPGIVYGWPKNVLHWNGITQSIYDINATLRPHLGIVDGIVGMEGDGPIMGDPVQAGVLAMGRNLVALDATCARVMGIDPRRIEHLWLSSDVAGLGPISEGAIGQRGETIAALRTDFRLLDFVPSQKGVRL